MKHCENWEMLIKSLWVDFSLARGAGESVKPGWSEALRAEPQDRWNKEPAREAGDSLFITSDCSVYAVARFAGLNFIFVADLGFRSESLHPRLYAIARSAG